MFTTLGPFVPVPEVRVPDADGLVLAAGEHHVGRRAVLERVAALRDPRVAHAAAAPESDRIDDSRVHKVLEMLCDRFRSVSRSVWAGELTSCG